MLHIFNYKYNNNNTIKSFGILLNKYSLNEHINKCSFQYIYTDIQILGHAWCSLLVPPTVLYLPSLVLMHMLSMSAEINEEQRLI